jgi:osmotically-inducible protein OsmY
VHLALKSNPGTEDIEISVEADNAKIILTGIVTNGNERKACENTVANVSGVREVDNQLKIIRGTKSFR